MKAVCVVQARMGAKRLPGKVAADICGRPMLAHIIDRLKTAQTLKEIIVATTVEQEDDVVCAMAEDCHVSMFRGPTEDVLGRVVRAVDQTDSRIIVHASGDNPLVDPNSLDILVRHCVEKHSDFCFMAGLPIGVGPDVFSRSTLKILDQMAATPMYREHVNAYVFDHISDFSVAKLLAPIELRMPQMRLTVDTPEDLELVRNIYETLYKPGQMITLKAVLALCKKAPEMFAINSHVEQLYVSETAKKLRELA